ncbi:MAG: 1-acyl-sn-glycerol-3-phosphate acyltransferase [Bdellovibrionales bacterium]|nr:1-acyl-sn-glycerol-3-phosphate acyltransferase [Bdellovibrionales bacterium]
MKRIVDWFFTIPFLAAFFSILAIFHILQVIASFISYSAHNFVLTMMNYCLIKSFLLVGTKVRICGQDHFPADRSLILISNHQSMYDIPVIVWTFRKHHPKFIAKLELARGIPSVSFALRTLGSALIDRSDPRQAMPAIKVFGSYVEANHFAACIFPEGTRARDGKIKRFKPSGVYALLDSMPSALIVPIAINGSWKLLRNNLRPVPFGSKFSMHVLDPIEPNQMNRKELVTEVHRRISEELERIE